MPSVRLVIAAAAIHLGSTGGAPAQGPEPAPRHFAVETVTILPMTVDGAPIPDATLVVRDGRIARIVIGNTSDIDPDLPRVDGRGRFLIPGLADMHVHALNRGYGRERGGQPFSADIMRTGDAMLPFLANGVTQILEMGALPESLQQRAEIEAGGVLGPRIATAAIVDGAPPIWALHAQIATTPEEGRKAVRHIKAAGFDFVKVYARLELPVFEAVLDEARIAGIGVVGHVPAGSRGHAERVLVPGFGMVAHAEEFAKLDASPQPADMSRYARLAHANDVWVATTLTTNIWIARQSRDPGVLADAPGSAQVHPLLRWQWLNANRYTASVTDGQVKAREELVEFNRNLLRRLRDEGVRIVAGTDAIIPGVVYGSSLHDELALMVAAGLSNREALESATRLPAEFLKVAKDRGAIEVGKAADFVLLEANPFDDIANTRSIAGVSVRGRYLARSELDALMADLARRYREMDLRPFMPPQ